MVGNATDRKGFDESKMNSVADKSHKWEEIETSIQASSLEEYNLEWGRLREEFFRQIGYLELPAADVERLAELKGKYVGERIFIIGNGPSLNRTPLNLLKNEYTFGVNRIYLLYDRINWKPTFYTALDWRVVPDIACEMNALTGSTFFFEERFRGLLREGDDVYYYTHKPAGRDHPEERQFSHDATRGLRGAGSVVGAAIQLAYHMGFDPIYLIGCDLGYKVRETVKQEGEDRFGTGVKIHLTSTQDDDPNHFDPRYFGKDRRWHDPNVKRMIEGHQQCRAAIEKAGRSIFNATIGGELEVYKRANFVDLLGDVELYECCREQHTSIDETQAVSHLLNGRQGGKYVMVDVGAHRGTSAAHFTPFGWTVYCFEPDPANRERLIKRFGEAPNIIIDPRAVSDKPAKGLSFFSSDESSGISALHAFRITHREVTRVDATTIADIAAERSLSRIDFLKIDVEGFDFSVLKGVPWDKLAPEVIECEFEDAKTVPLGHTWKDIAEFLRGKGYTVYISEWHPIVRYGVAHDWRRLVPYPGVEIDTNAWGNLLAFRQDPGYAALRDAFHRLVKTRGAAAADADKREKASAVRDAAAAKDKLAAQKLKADGAQRAERPLNGDGGALPATSIAARRNKRLAALTSRIGRVETKLDEILATLKK